MYYKGGHGSLVSYYLGQNSGHNPGQLLDHEVKDQQGRGAHPVNQSPRYHVKGLTGRE